LITSRCREEGRVDKRRYGGRELSNDEVIGADGAGAAVGERGKSADVVGR